MKLIIIGLLTLTYFKITYAEEYRNLLTEVQSMDQFKRFNQSLPRDSFAVNILKGRPAVAFIPNNQAFEIYEKEYPGKSLPVDFPEGHLAQRITDETFESNQPHYSQNQLSLFFNKVKVGEDEYEYYVNEGKILNKEDPIKVYTGRFHQTLYIVDRVLSDRKTSNDALFMLKNPSQFDIEESVSQFVDKIEDHDQTDLFNSDSPSTYFIPIDGDDSNFDDIDKETVRGHVIPGKVLFTRAMKGTFKSDMYDENEGIKVNLSLVKSQDDKTNEKMSYKIKSDTMITATEVQGQILPRKGVVLSDMIIEQSNIVCENGIIHLIRKPLMVMESTVLEILEKERDGRLSEFMKLVDKSPDLKEEIEDSNYKTIFVPSNRAFDMIPNKKFINETHINDEKRKELLQLHMVRDSVTSYDVLTKQQYSRMNSFDEARFLYFHSGESGDNRTLSVEGGGVHATVVDVDIGATNGIVHIINHVLGVPFRTIYEKLKMNAKLSTSFNFGEGSKWIHLFKNPTRNFTFFVPNNKAWQKFENEHPTTFKQLALDGKFSDEIPKILDRHLILDKVYTQEDLLKMVSKNLKTKGASLKVSMWEFMQSQAKKETDKVQLTWRKRPNVDIVRPDIEATNGIIHVVDGVFMDRDDITSGVDVITASFISTLISLFIVKLV